MRRVNFPKLLVVYHILYRVRFKTIMYDKGHNSGGTFKR